MPLPPPPPENESHTPYHAHQTMVESDFESIQEPMNNNASPSPGLSQLPSSSSIRATPTIPPLPPTTHSSAAGTPQSHNSGISALSGLSGGGGSISGIVVSGTGSLLRGPPLTPPFPPPLLPQSQHYFRPIIQHHHHHQHHPYTGRAHDDFDLTSDSDAVSSPPSSIIGPPPPLPPGIGRPPSLTPRLPSIYNGNPPPPINPPVPPGSGTFICILELI